MSNDDGYHLERFSKTDVEFDDFYDKKLKQKVAALENERQKKMKLVKKQIMKFILPLTVVIILFFLYRVVFLLSIPVILSIGGYLFKDIKKQKNELLKKMKEEIVTDLVYFMNEKFTYEPTKCLSSTEFRIANIFKNKPNRYTGDDLIKGYVGEDSHTTENAGEPRTDISFSEIKADSVEIYRDKNWKKKEQIHTIFSGLFFKVDFNKDFDGLTIVVPKQKSSKRVSIFGKEKKNKLEEVELDDLDFMKMFTVRTTNQILARYILTPRFMERLLQFAHRQSEEYVQQPKTIKEAIQLGASTAHNEYDAYSDIPYFSFRNGKMYFMLPTLRNHFDFSLYVPLNKRLIHSYFYDINIALEMIDELNLNLRIWDKK